MRDDRIFAIFCDIMYTTNRNVAWEKEQQIAKAIFHVYTEYKSVHTSKFEQFAKRFQKPTSPTSDQNKMSFNKIQQQQKKEHKRKQNNNNNNNNFSDGDSSQCSYISLNAAHSYGSKQSKRRRNKKNGNLPNNNNVKNNNVKNNNKKNNKKKKK